MRKNLILSAAAFAALAFAGCSQDDTLNESPAANKAIEFGTYVGRDAVSRAEDAAALAALKQSGFGVYAYYTGQENFETYYTNATDKPAPNFMYNQEVKWGTPGSTASSATDDWYYSPVKYWPNNENDKVSFFAYAPYMGTPNEEDAAKSTSTIKFTVASEAKEQKDLLLSKIDGQNIDVGKLPTNDDERGRVKFEFTHALARIGFSVTGAVDQVEAGGSLAAATTITVNKVSLSSDGYEWNGTDKKYDEPTTGAFYQSGKLNLATGNWSDQSGTQLFVLKSNTDATQTNFKANTLSSTVTTISQLNADDSYLMVIPQNLNNLYVNIEYTVTTEDSNLDGGKSEITNYISKQISSINFEAGKAYTLNLILGMRSVKVTASVIGWTIVTPSTDVDLPENTETPDTPAPTPGA